ncbi:MAG: hypothetical protein K0Q76_3182 [Panacagrimonas sp.]|nr:DUF883 family protein [Panacagrimonas sp.]MCC2658074.1 hypothetical protein [Panacagrimonas sp.]
MREERAASAENPIFGAASSAIPPERGQADSGGSIRNRFIGDLQTLVGHAQELMQLTSSVSGESISQVRDQLRQSLDTATTTIKRLQADAMDRGREMAQRTDTYVHENPWQSIAAGAVAGVALGLAASSLMRSGGEAKPSSRSSKRH